MAVNAVSSNNVPAAPAARPPEPKQVIDKPAEQKAAPPPPQAQPAKPAASVNTSGQTVGTTINTSA